MKKLIAVLLGLISLLSVSGCDAGRPNAPASGEEAYGSNEITITAGDTILNAVMYDNDTARAFMDLLPLTLPTIERSGLAKGVHLPEFLPYDEAALTREYSLGEIGYWPGGDIAIFYNDTRFEQTIVDVIQIGKIEQGVELFEQYDGEVTITRTRPEERIFEYERSEMYASVNGAEIYGTAYTPVGAGESMPAVILSHGYGGNYNTNASYSQTFARHGYFAYTFDFRGGSPGSRSDGSTIEMSIFTEEEDLKAVVSMVQSLDAIDKERIFLFGTSQGGLVSAMAAADLQEEICGTILLYPAFSIVDDAREMFSAAENVPDTVDFMWMTVGRAYFENLFGYDPYTDAARYEKEVLILHGDRDGIVPLSASQKAAEYYDSAQLYVIEGAGHGFGGSDQELAESYILRYLREHS